MTTGEGCVQCPINTYSSRGAASCTPCTVGKISPSGSTKENDCVVGGRIASNCLIPTTIL